MIITVIAFSVVMHHDWIFLFVFFIPLSCYELFICVLFLFLLYCILSLQVYITQSFGRLFFFFFLHQVNLLSEYMDFISLRIDFLLLHSVFFHEHICKIYEEALRRAT